MTLRIEIERRVGMLPPLMSQSNTGDYYGIASRMLRDYLRRRTSFSADLLSEIVEAVKNSKTHYSIKRKIEDKVHRDLKQKGYELNHDELTGICRYIVENYGEIYPDGSVTKANFGDSLQPIISSVQELNFVESSILQSRGKLHTYSCTYEIVDEYDFDNDRSGQPIYDNYRNGLAALMRDDIIRQRLLWFPSINKFDLDAITIVLTGRIEEGVTDKAEVIAALLYAAQKNGFYKGIPWRVNVPFTFTIETETNIYPRMLDEVWQAPEPRLNMVAKSPPRPGGETQRARTRRMRRHFIEPHPPLKNPVYVVKAGDTLSDLAKRFLGDAGKWKLIYNLNKGAIGLDPNLIRVGLKLRVPLF